VNRQSDDLTQELPDGTVTFLFTDIEGSTKLLHGLGDKYISLLAEHHRILRDVFSRWNGREVDTEGDAFFVSFPRATEAAAAVVEAQRSLTSHNWPGEVTVRVRMGLHTGEPWTGSGGYVGMDVHRAARIAHVGHGGQVLLSETTAALLRDGLPTGTSLVDLGRHRLKDMTYPEHIRQLVIKGLPAEFPPLKSLELLGTDVSDEEVVRLPGYLNDETTEEVLPVFVGREGELDRLDVALDRILEGQGSVFFVAGDAGSGKTALMDAYARQAHEKVPNLLIARGTCNAITGAGDPYLPFRTTLRALTGDVESQWEAGTITGDQARNLWQSLPLVSRSIVEHGPDLVDTFVPGSGLISRTATAMPAGGDLLKRLQEVVEREKPVLGELVQLQLFQQYTEVLREVAQERPVLLTLDDLQWADSGSINLLFHLGRELTGGRILVLAAYRPEEVALGRTGSRHPLAPVLDEFKRSFGDIWIDLNQAKNDSFVEDFVNSEPNRLGVEFRRMLFRHTGGHALFTVELLRDLQERGDLRQDEVGQWIESPSLAWESLPARVEGVIEARIDRLEEELREILTVAAVEGQEFTAQVVARVQQIQERRLLRSLSQELAKRHQLVKKRQGFHIGEKLLSRYRFAHNLFQRYLYNDLSPGERRLLHGEIAPILEELYAGNLYRGRRRKEGDRLFSQGRR